MINEAFFEELLSRQKESGLNGRDFCSNEGIHPSTFYYWLKKHSKKNRPKEFIPFFVQNTIEVQHPGKICVLGNP